MLIANAHLVPRWATWDEFRRLDALGLTMYGQMTAGSWIYIGTQGILQGTYETFAECARQHFGGTLAGRLVVTGGLGGMGGAQPLAATMNGAAFLGVDVDESRIRRRVETRYCDRLEHDLDAALAPGRGRARRGGGALSVGLVGNIAEVLPELVRRGVRARRAHRPDLGARPARGLHPGRALAGGRGRAARARSGRLRGPGARLDGGRTCGRCWTLQARGAVTFDYGNNLRGQVADHRGMPEAFDDPRASCRRSSVRSSAAAPGRSAGRRSPATRPTSPRPTRRCSRPFPRRRRWRAGSGRRRSGCSSRGCRPGSAGSSTASGPRWGFGSTGW